MITQTLTSWIPWFRPKEEPVSSQWIGWLALIGLILAGATYNPFAKELTTKLSPLSLLFLSEGLTGLFVLLTYGTIPVFAIIRTLTKKQWVPLVFLGICNGIVAPFLIFQGLKSTTAVNAELFGRTELVAMVILATIFLGERLKPAQIGASMIILLGTLFVALRGFSEGVAFYYGDLLILFGAMMFACGNIAFKKYLHEQVPPHIVIIARTTVSLSLFFLISPFVDHTLIEDLHLFPLAMVPALIGFGFVSRFLNLFCFYQAIERLPVTIFSLFLTVNIIVGVLFAYLYLGEAIFWYHMIGGGLIICGVMIMQIVGVHGSEDELESHLRQHHRHHL